MDKKKILSVLIISLIVLGSVLFVVKSLEAVPSDCNEYLTWCVLDYCHANPACMDACHENYYKCLNR